MKSFDQFLTESVFRFKWEGITPKDVTQYVKINKLRLMDDPENKEYQIAIRSGNTLVFRYDPDEYMLYTDYTIIQLEDGKAK